MKLERMSNSSVNLPKALVRPSQGVSGTGEKGYLFQGNRGTKAKFCGEQGNKDNIGEQGT